ncbi:MAG TPA: hypothetical protein VFA33_29285 [Bryobacteraceae bacterium]|nr:hypothetical protein [Bryobacteraceae bacterium]
MACPYFYPVARLDWASGATAMPLGDAWTGNCEADPEQPIQPREDALIPLCNLGYAHACPRFPRGAPADAVRFSVIRDQNGLVSICYVLERDHAPVEHGSLVYARGSRTFVAAHPHPRVQRQAEAYLESYLLRKNSLTHAEAQTGS